MDFDAFQEELLMLMEFALFEYDLLQYFVLAKEEVIFVRYTFAKGETRRHQCNC
jgi:hypothetical protein